MFSKIILWMSSIESYSILLDIFYTGFIVKFIFSNDEADGCMMCQNINFIQIRISQTNQIKTSQRFYFILLDEIYFSMAKQY